MNENKVKSQIQNYLKKIGAYQFKVHGDIYMRAGIPDLICCVKGRFVGIECKDYGNKPSELQLAHGRQIVKNGGVFIVAYCVEDVEKALKNAKII